MGATPSATRVTTEACNRGPEFGASAYDFTISDNTALNRAVAHVVRVLYGGPRLTVDSTMFEWSVAL